MPTVSLPHRLEVPWQRHASADARICPLPAPLGGAAAGAIGTGLMPARADRLPPGSTSQYFDDGAVGVATAAPRGGRLAPCGATPAVRWRRLTFMTR